MDSIYSFLLGVHEKTVCRCNAVVQLLTCGYFPCSPINPSLAVHLPVMDFTACLFIQSLPGIGAWTDCLEDYFNFCGYKFPATTRVSTRLS
jgi:hypothetical protein